MSGKGARNVFMASRAAVRFAIVASLVALVALTGCRWREGRSVLLPSDGGHDADAAWLSQLTAADLLALITTEGADAIVIDIRPLDRYAAGHVPGALSHPWNGSSFEPEIDVPDEPGWLVIYDENGELIQAPFDALPELSTRTVGYLASGFSEWSDAGYPIDQGEP